ncbi:MAG: triose-phosphate isomerase [Paludibacteraceae bacterium]|nr:triose-phosphate isomerase [Paludibacteraceae bacterium]
MRTKMVAGNWKMNTTLQEGIQLGTQIKNALQDKQPACEVVIATPFIHLSKMAELMQDSIVKISAENCADKTSGAYTGEVSAAMVRSTGAQYTILGHSERRAYYHEDYDILRQKVLLALENGLKVIFCIGEVKEEREAGRQNEVVKAQLEGSVFNLTAEQFANITLAYEPVWAIGTGLTATPAQAQEMHAYLRSLVAEQYGQNMAEDTTILYGGSCNAKNAAELFANPDVDGGLIGGASLKADDFMTIIMAR